MKKLITILLVKLIAVFTLSAKGTQIEILSPKIDSIIAKEQGRNLPGGAIAVVSSQGLIYKNTFGVMDVEKKIDIDENTLFDQASIAKQFTAFAILLLEQEGKLDLDKDINTYLPNLPTYEHEVTTRHLLQHTSGIASTDWLRLVSDLAFDEVWHHNDEVSLINRYSQLNFKPNTQHVYSNGGYSLLASIVESVSGMPFGDFMNQRIFKPLEMETALVYSDLTLKPTNNAIGYRIQNGTPTQVSSTNDFSYGSGNLWASLNDMAKWGQNFFAPKVGDAEMIKRITNKYNTLENGDSLFYTYGFYVRKYKGVKMVDHQGGVPGFRNYFMMFPNDNLIIIASFNNESIAARDIVNGIADVLLADKIVVQPTKPRIEVGVNIEKAKRFAGTYELPDGMELTFQVEQDTLWLLLPGDHKFPLFAEDDYKFFLKAFDAQCTFEASETNEVNKMVWHQRGRSYPGARIGARISLSAEEIKNLAGKYIHHDLKTEYPVTFENGTLYIQTPSTFKKYLGIEGMELKHTSGYRFLTSKFGTLEFTHDTSGKVTGFLMPEVGRLQNVRFSKVED